jgi:hypothetical protein
MGTETFVPPTFTQHFERLPPEHLYHYTGQAGLIGIVNARELWTTKIQFMNDATEFGLALKIARKELDSIMTRSTSVTQKAACARLSESLSGLEDINIFAVCFCEDGDLLSQWRGYSGSSHGYSIAFDSESLMHVANLENFQIGRCIYDSETQWNVIHEGIVHCIENEVEWSSTARRWGFHGPLAEILFKCGGFFKDASFKEEQEWRIISPTILFNDERLGFRTGKSTIVPYYRLSILCEGVLPIRHVIVGPCPHMELARSAVTALMMSSGDRRPLDRLEVALPSKIPFRNW